MPTSQPTRIPLPPAVQALLGRVGQRARLAALLRSLTVAGLGGEGAWLSLYALDRCGDTPAWARLALFEAALLVGLLAAGVGWRALRRCGSLAAWARLVMRREPPAGHLLLSAVELADSPVPEAAARPLLEAALRQVAEACAGLDPRRLVRLAPAPGLTSGLALCTVALLPAAAGAPRALGNALHRLATPLAEVPRVTRVTIAELPSRVVPCMEPSRLLVRVAARRGPLPQALRWRLDNGVQGRSPVGPDGVCRLILPALDQPADLVLACGDARARDRLVPARRPALLSLEAVSDGNTVNGVRTTLVPGPCRLSLPVGATLRLEGTADLPLADVRIGRSRNTPVPVSRPAAERFAADLGAVAADTDVSLAWRSGDGLWGHGPLHVRVEAVPDRAPVLTWTPGPPPASALATALLTVRAAAADDRGLARFALRVGNAAGQRLERSLNDSARPRQAELELTVCPADLGLLPGQSLRIEALADDAAPDREPAILTAEVALLGESTQSAELTARARRAWQRLEGIVTAESRQADSERTAATQPTPAPRLDEILAAGGGLAAADAEATRDLAVELGRLAEAAQLSAGFDDEVTAAWIEAQRSLEAVARDAFPALLAALRPPASGTAPTAGRLQAVWSRRQDIVAALRAVLASEGAFRRCAVRTAALRLQEAARAEQALATDLGALPDIWAGQAVEQLDAAACACLADLSRRQEQVGDELDALSAVLHDLAAGGAPPPYGRVAAALDQSALAADLRQAAEQIRRNHRFFALSTAEDAAVALSAWARELMADTAAAAGTPGSGQGAAPGAPGGVTLRLRRLLLAQEALRERVAAMAAIAVADGLRQTMAGMLATHQASLAEGLPEVSRVCPGPLVRLLDQAASAMGVAADHLRAARLEPAQAAQAAASEWLLTCLQSVRSGASADAGGSSAASAAAGTVALGQAGSRGPAEAPLTAAATAAHAAPGWTGRPGTHSDTALRAAVPTEVPAPYRALWEHYRRRLEESTP